MKKGLLIVFLCVLGLGLMAQTQSFVPNRIVVRLSQQSLKSSKPNQLLHGILSKHSDEYLIRPMFPTKQGKLKSAVPEKYDLSTLYFIDVENSVAFFNLLEELNVQPGVNYATPYYIPELLAEANDPFVGSQYYISKVNMLEAHDVHFGDTNVVIGIVDTGVDIYHEDLVDRYKYNYDDPVNGIDDDLDGYVDNYRGWDVAMNDNNPQSLANHHGTRVAAMASATNNNDIGLYGMGGLVKLLPVKTMNNKGVITAGYEGIVYAADHGCQIINCSWGSQVKNPLCDDVVAYATEYRKALIVAAAGNSKTDQPFYPASCDGVLSVGASNSLDVKWNNSTYGIELDICAPGEAVLTANQGNAYTYGYGTSLAAPLVAGAAGLLKSYKPDYTPHQLREQLRISADVIDTLPDNLFYNRQMGYGRLNAYRALAADTLASVRIDKLDVKMNSHAAANDTIFLSTYLSNYLAPLPSATLRLSNDDDFAQVLNQTYITGSLNTLESKNNADKPFSLVVSPDAPYDYLLRNTFEIKGSNYDDYQIFDLLINPSSIAVNPNNIATSFTSNGKIAYANQEKRIGTGLLWKGVYSILNEAGILLATNADNMVNAIAGEYDFEIKQVVDTMDVNNTYLQGKSAYAPKEGSSSLQIEIMEQNKGYYAGDFASSIFYTYQVINKGSLDIEGMVFSLFADWDIFSADANQVAYYEDLNLLYTYSNLDQNLYAGICLLNRDEAMPHTFDFILGGNGGLDITEDFSDNQKWYAMTNPRYTAGTDGDTINVGTMLSTQAFDIPIGDTVSIDYVLIVAENLGTLKDRARKAQDLFYVPPSTSIPQEAVSRLLLYPNPTKQNLTLSFDTEYTSGTIQIHNQEGKMVYSRGFENTNNLELNLSLNDGLYYLRIINPKGVSVKKFTISN